MLSAYNILFTHLTVFIFYFFLSCLAVQNGNVNVNIKAVICFLSCLIDQNFSQKHCKYTVRFQWFYNLLRLRLTILLGSTALVKCSVSPTHMQFGDKAKYIYMFKDI